MQLITAVYDEKSPRAMEMPVGTGGAALSERSSSDPLWSFLRTLCLNLAIVVMIGFPSVVPSLAESCIVVDSDADLDDFRAVITLASTGELAAIVITEGIARAHEGAGAMENLLSRAGLVVPVIVGASADPERQYTPDKNLPEWRRAAEQLNGTLTNPISPSIQTDGNFVRTVRRVTAKCSTVSLLVIGPWTSFLRYAADLLPKVDLIKVQWRPYPDEPGGEPAGFNCVYDIEACRTSFDLLTGRQLRADRRLRVNWVDIPNGAESCGSAEPGVDGSGKRVFAFRPTEQWIHDLQGAGKAAHSVAEVLNEYPYSWHQTSLWDDLAALFLLRPDIFGRRGGHFEPCVPAATVRNLLTEAMSRTLAK
jgi:hypothetical protein